MKTSVSSRIAYIANKVMAGKPEVDPGLPGLTAPLGMGQIGSSTLIHLVNEDELPDNYDYAVSLLLDYAPFAPGVR